MSYHKEHEGPEVSCRALPQWWLGRELNDPRQSRGLIWLPPQRRSNTGSRPRRLTRLRVSAGRSARLLAPGFGPRLEPCSFPDSGAKKQSARKPRSCLSRERQLNSNRRTGQTSVSSPAEPGAYLTELADVRSGASISGQSSSCPRDLVRTAFLNLEATRLDPRSDEIVEVGILDEDGQIRLDALVRPVRHR